MGEWEMGEWEMGNPRAPDRLRNRELGGQGRHSRVKRNWGAMHVEPQHTGRILVVDDEAGYPVVDAVVHPPQRAGNGVEKPISLVAGDTKKHTAEPGSSPGNPGEELGSDAR